MKGVIYARYSSDNQREESIEGQLRECKEYAERNDITILGTYIDRALSAKTDNRPEFQHMIKESAKGLFDVVLVWKLDRFARNRYDSARYKNLLKKNGVKVISARENISEGSEGIILEAMLEGYAEYYSAELSEKVIRGLTDNALKCKYNGGTVPMGYYIDEQQYYQIDPKTAPVVLEMFTKYSEGATMQELVNLLNSRGMRSIRGGKITLNIMNHLLKNRRYMGEYSYRDVVKENGIPAIVPKELFERVQERLAKNKKAPARHKAEDDYLLTTKLYCGKCGSFMVGESGTSHTMKVHRYYRCVNTKKKKLCDKKAVKKDWIEDLVVNYTMKAIMNDEVMERLIDTLMELQKKESTDLPLLKKQLAETEKGINNMLNAIQAGIFTPSTKQRLDELEETKSQLEVSILQEEMHKPLLTREQIARYADKNMDFAHMKICSKCLRNNYDDEVIKVIVADGLSISQMEMALEFYEKGVPIEAVKKITQSGEKAVTMKKLYEDSLAEGNKFEHDREPEYVTKIIKYLERMNVSLSNADKRFTEVEDVLRTLLDNNEEQQDFDRILKENQEKDVLLSEKQDEINKAYSQATENSREREALRKENKKLREKISELEEKYSKKKKSDTEVIEFSKKESSEVDNLNRHIRIDSNSIERKTTVNSRGAISIFTKLAIRTKSRRNLVKLVIEGELDKNQLIQIKSAIEKGLTESQLEEIINGRISAERMKEIIEIAELENSMNG